MKLPFWATLMTLCGVAILCALGSWQLQRLAWKNNLIAELENAYETPVDPLISADINEAFAYGTIEGQLLSNKALLISHAVKNNKPGKFLIVPLQTKDATWLVNFGWNDNETALTDTPIGQYNNQKLSITGLARKPSWNSFTPKNIPETDTWYRYDIDEIAQAKDLKAPAPFILYADKASKDFGDQFPHHEKWEPKNNHAQYAFFWFALAGTLVIIYVLRFLVATPAKKNP